MENFQREIKFRAWDKDKKLMFQHQEFPYTRYIESHNVGGSNPIILMQYTGLKDKNGTEIYEGDVLSPAIARSRDLEIVKWDEQEACWGNDNWYLYELIGDYEVIGNIYENPELIKTH